MKFADLGLKEVKPNQFHIIFFNSNIIKSMEYILHTYPVKHGRLNTQLPVILNETPLKGIRKPI